MAKQSGRGRDAAACGPLKNSRLKRSFALPVAGMLQVHDAQAGQARAAQIRPQDLPLSLARPHRLPNQPVLLLHAGERAFEPLHVLMADNCIICVDPKSGSVIAAAHAFMFPNI